MVFQDYELIPTKRVNHDRRGTKSIFFNRLYLAAGGHSTTYLTSFAIYSTALYYRMHGVTPVLPKPALIGAAGLSAFLVSVNVLGNGREFLHLARNYVTYRKEFKMIKNELYYN